MTTRQTLYFARPYQIEVRQEPIPDLQPHQVLVQTSLSAISAGTEMLFYRGQVPDDMAIDATIAGMDGAVHYPLSYGYSCVGIVVATGSAVDASWRGRRVFAFHPHSSHFVCDPATLLPIPEGITDEQALFLPNMETAVNFVMDARPLIGERVVVFGLGIVGLLTSMLLCRFPLAHLLAFDAYAKRLELVKSLGIDAAQPPVDWRALSDLDPDIILEVSSNPAALETAIQLAGFGTRIIVGSWYGKKVAQLPLGGSFHRNRVQIISSQVSTLDASLSNRWDKARRLHTAWQQLRSLPTEQLITHRLPLAAASEAYTLLDQQPEQALQVIFTYSQNPNH